MKHIFFLASVFTWMCSCSGDPAESTNDSAAIDSVLDTVIKIDSPIHVVSVDTPVDDVVVAERKYMTAFTVYFTTSYCGGARPSQEIVAGHEAPRLFASSSLRLKNHHTGKEYFIKTNPAGVASHELEEGKYDVFLTNDILTSLNTGFDTKCATWKQQLLVTVKIGPNSKAQDVNIHFVCNPCDDDIKKRQ